jgi:hypothetical protein
VACIFVILDLAGAGLRRWWDDHALTTDTVAGLLVLMITVLVADQAIIIGPHHPSLEALGTEAKRREYYLWDESACGWLRW